MNVSVAPVARVGKARESRVVRIVGFKFLIEKRECSFMIDPDLLNNHSEEL